MAIVTIMHELRTLYDPDPAIVETQTYLLLPERTGPHAEAELPPSVPELGDRYMTFVPDETQLFQYSALGFNSHKIHIDKAYRDLQLTAIVVDPLTGSNAAQTVNAAKAAVSGAEIEGKYLISSDDKVNFSVTYLDAHFKSYKPTPTVDWAGYRLDKSPRTNASLSYSHSFSLDSGAVLKANIGTRYSASYVLSDYGNGVQFTQGAYHMSDASLTYAPGGNNWSLQGYVRNIENKTIMTNYSASFAGFPATVGLGTPRTAGVRLSAYF